MADEELVSILTPVYNGEQFLEECIQSVLRQTHSNWEYIIADNMSTDRTPEIAQRYASQDARIRLIRGPDFLDVYGSHNRALAHMNKRARYCKVLHADDWLYPHCLTSMVDVMQAHPSVGVVSSFRLVGNRVEHESPVAYPRVVMSGKNFIRSELLGEGFATGSPSSVLLRADLVRGCRSFYDPTVWHGDTDAVYRVLLESDFAFIHQVLTFTRMHPGAQTPFSFRVYSFITRDGRLLQRYGPYIMDSAAYRRHMRQWLGRYGRWLVRERLKSIGKPRPDFDKFHREEIGYILAESGGDPLVNLALSLYRATLLG